MGQITTHILDTSQGIPAGNVSLHLSVLLDDQWHIIAEGKTNDDGRVDNFLPDDTVLEPGTYRMHFATADYFTAQKKPVFYPWVDVVFVLASQGEHYHIPLLLSPFSYSTYRGS